MTTTPSVIYAFGDSLSDAGDAYLVTDSPDASALGYAPEPVSPPYAQETYPDGTTADVFSNGPVWVQDLATDLGITAPAPAEVGVAANTLLAALVAESTSSFAAGLIVDGLEAQQNVSGPDAYVQLAAGAAGGTDFAIGGSVTGPTAENSGATVGLTDLAAQLANFQNEVTQPAADALYTVWSGSNDLLNLLEDANFASLDAAGTVATDIAAAVANEIGMVSDLVAGGAQSVLLLDVPDLGKVPAITGLDSTTLDAAASAISATFDQQLATAVQTTNFGSAHVVLDDTYALIDNAITNPGSYDLSNTSGSVYTGSFTADSNGLVSTDPAVQDTYLFFDGQHPTETGQSFIAASAEAALAAACFLRGTRIATPRGEIPIEHLSVGDLVLTHDGAAKPVVWLGHRPFDTRRHPHPQQVWPIRLRAGALAEGVPARDLLVSPGHSLLLDGVLIQAEKLINGATILRDSGIVRSAYFHVELHQHDIVMSEGVASESYLDTGNRRAFLNGGDFVDLYPDFSPRHWTQTCRPLVQDGPLLAANQQRLADRAVALGWRLATAVAPVLRINGKDIAPSAREGWLTRWHIPRGTEGVRLRSSAAVLAACQPDAMECRRLGVVVDRIIVTRGRTRAEWALDDPRLTEGWHPVETEGHARWRWTDGDAAIALRGPCRLQLSIEKCLPAWRAPETAPVGPEPAARYRM